LEGGLGDAHMTMLLEHEVRKHLHLNVKKARNQGNAGSVKGVEGEGAI